MEPSWIMVKSVRDERVETFVLVFDVAEHGCTICPKHRTGDWNFKFFSKHLVKLDGKGCGS